MRSISISADRPAEICIAGRSLIREIWIRQNIHEEDYEIETEGEEYVGKQFVCDEAYMKLDASDCPSVDEIEDDFESWFDYAASWQPAREKSLAQVQADVEYIAAMTGIDLEV